MKLFKIITILFVLLSLPGFSQRHSELGVILGTSYYVGELNRAMPIVNKVNPAIGVFYRKNLNSRYALRFGANYGKLSASDNFNNNPFSEFRQLSFSSDLYEGYGILEFNFLPYSIGNNRVSLFSPYVFIGAAGFMVNPDLESEVSSNVISRGSLISFSIPFGAGIKFTIAKHWGVGLEWGMRKTFTDEIDGLSETFANTYQLSNSQNKDWYSIVGITLNYKILTKDARCIGVVN